MKRYLFEGLLALVFSFAAFGEITTSVGSGVNFDADETPQFTPLLDMTLVGHHSWVATDRLGLFFDWSGGGSYEPGTGALSGLFAASADGSYMVGKFLSRLSLSSVANPSTVDEFYGATSASLLLSYGGTDLSVFAEPRLSLVEDSGTKVESSGQVGTAVLLLDSLLLKPAFEAGMSVPAGSSWRINPSISLDWYPDGPITLGVLLGYAKSYSTDLASLVSGGPLLPLDTWDRISLSANFSWLIGNELSLTAHLPCDYYLKTYNAYDGSVDLGVPTWLVQLEPTVDFRIPLSNRTDFLLSAKGSFDLSNNVVERIFAVSTTVHFEVHL